VTFKGADAPRVLELVVAAQSPPVRLCEELEAFWGAVAKGFDARPDVPPFPPVGREAYQRFNYPKARVTDLQHAADVYVRAPAANVLLRLPQLTQQAANEITTTKDGETHLAPRATLVKHGGEFAIGLRNRSLPNDAKWLADFFAGFAPRWEDRPGSADHPKIFALAPKPGPEAAARPFAFYYRLTVTFPPPAADDAPPGRPVVRMLPTANVPAALRFGDPP